ncbi:unnamed protein product [Ostreobium quekettii]|uniref:F-box/LRR-repeat protein 15-like leucin rich repeat domain-containing protein n=1 Tax=Ostreobium quekettii TaxID=121088 RepID=A0A8S1IVD2_9CHLO|nr:unnamed protein product [Ostreobium quekettii]
MDNEEEREGNWEVEELSGSATTAAGVTRNSVPKLTAICVRCVASLIISSDHHGNLHGLCILPSELKQDIFELVVATKHLNDVLASVLWSEEWVFRRAALSLAGNYHLSATRLTQLLHGDCPNLRSISFADVVTLTDEVLEQLVGTCCNLTNLDISLCCWVTDRGLQTLTALKNLQSLNIQGCWKVTSVLHLTSCNDLRTLNVSECWQLTPAGVGMYLSAAGKLEVLDIGGCRFLDNTALLGYGTASERINSLVLRGTRVTDALLGKLSSLCPNLHHIDLRGCMHVSGTGVAVLLQSFGGARDGKTHPQGRSGGLRTLKVAGITDLWGAICQTCLPQGYNRHTEAQDVANVHAAWAENLTCLDVSYCSDVSDTALHWLAVHCPRLQRLMAVGLLISDEGVGHLTCLRNLRYLNLGRSQLARNRVRKRRRVPLSDDSMAAVCKSLCMHNSSDCLRDGCPMEEGVSDNKTPCAGLAVLGVSGTAITDRTLKHMSGIVSLNLHHCVHVTSTGILQLLLNCPNLGKLNVSGCTALDPTELGATAACRQPHRGSYTSQVLPSSSKMPKAGTGPLGSSLDAIENLVRALKQCPARCARLIHVTIPGCISVPEVLLLLTGLVRAPTLDFGLPCGVLSRLEHLEVTNAGKIDDALLIFIVDGCPLLRDLLLFCATVVSDVGLSHAVAKLPFLQRLTLTKAKEVTDRGVADLTKLACLQSLDLSECRKVRPPLSVVYTAACLICLFVSPRKCRDSRYNRLVVVKFQREIVWILTLK